MSEKKKTLVKKIQENIKNRLNTCENCSEYRKTIKQCKVCGCLVPLKASIPSSKCPLNKW